MIKLVLIAAVFGLLLLLLRSHGTTRGGAYVKIGMSIFLVFCAYAVIRPEDVSWVAAQLGVGRGTDLVLYLLVVGFGFFAISTYLRFKELELKYARLARAVALLDAENRDAERGTAQNRNGRLSADTSTPRGSTAAMVSDKPAEESA